MKRIGLLLCLCFGVLLPAQSMAKPSCKGPLKTGDYCKVPPMDCEGDWIGNEGYKMGGYLNGMLMQIEHVFRYSIGGYYDEDWNMYLRAVDVHTCPDKAPDGSDAKLFGRSCNEEREKFVDIFWASSGSKWRNSETNFMLGQLADRFWDDSKGQWRTKMPEGLTKQRAIQYWSTTLAELKAALPGFGFPKWAFRDVPVPLLLLNTIDGKTLGKSQKHEIGRQLWRSWMRYPRVWGRTQKVTGEVQISTRDPEDEWNNESNNDMLTKSGLSRCERESTHGLCNRVAMVYGSVVIDKNHDGGKPELHPLRMVVTASNLGNTARWTPEPTTKPIDYVIRAFADYGKAANAGSGHWAGRMCENWHKTPHPYGEIPGNLFVPPAKHPGIEGEGRAWCTTHTLVAKESTSAKKLGLDPRRYPLPKKTVTLDACPTFRYEPFYRKSDGTVYGGYGVVRMTVDRRKLRGHVEIESIESIGHKKKDAQLTKGLYAQWDAHYYRVTAKAVIEKLMGDKVGGARYLPVKQWAPWHPSANIQQRKLDPQRVELFVPVAPNKGIVQPYSFHLKFEAPTPQNDTFWSAQKQVLLPVPMVTIMPVHYSMGLVRNMASALGKGNRASRQRLPASARQGPNTAARATDRRTPAGRNASASPNRRSAARNRDDRRGPQKADQPRRGAEPQRSQEPRRRMPESRHQETDGSSGKDMVLAIPLKYLAKVRATTSLQNATFTWYIKNEAGKWSEQDVKGQEVTLAFAEDTANKRAIKVVAKNAFETATSVQGTQIPRLKVATVATNNSNAVADTLILIHNESLKHQTCISQKKIDFFSSVRVHPESYLMPPNLYGAPPPKNVKFVWSDVERTQGDGEWAPYGDSHQSGDDLLVNIPNPKVKDWAKLNFFRARLTTTDHYQRSIEDWVYFKNFDDGGSVEEAWNCVSTLDARFLSPVMEDKFGPLDDPVKWPRGRQEQLSNPGMMQELRIARFSDTRFKDQENQRRGNASRRNSSTATPKPLRYSPSRRGPVSRRPTKARQARQARKTITLKFDPENGADVTRVNKLMKSARVVLEPSSQSLKARRARLSKRLPRGKRSLGTRTLEYEDFYRLQTMLPLLNDIAAMKNRQRRPQQQRPTKRRPVQRRQRRPAQRRPGQNPRNQRRQQRRRGGRR